MNRKTYAEKCYPSFLENFTNLKPISTSTCSFGQSATRIIYVSRIVPHISCRERVGAKDFSPLPLPRPFPNTSGFANPRYFTAVMQPRVISISVTVVTRVRFGRGPARPNNPVARVIYSLISTVVGIVCSEDCVYCRQRVIKSGH